MQRKYHRKHQKIHKEEPRALRIRGLTQKILIDRRVDRPSR